MTGPQRFPFLDADPTQPGASLMPLLPLTLTNGTRELTASGLLDTGAAVNVLPYSIGVELGFRWEEQRTSIVLSGNLGRTPARGVIVTARVTPFLPVRLAFAWSQSDQVRLILGQANFFMEYDVCFYRSRQAFDVHPKAEFERDQP